MEQQTWSCFRYCKSVTLIFRFQPKLTVSVHGYLFIRSSGIKVVRIRTCDMLWIESKTQFLLIVYRAQFSRLEEYPNGK